MMDEPIARILTLDLATKIGWAVRADNGRIRHGVEKLPDTGPDVGHFLDKFELWLADMITGHDPQRCVYEAPWVGPDTHQNTARKLLCLAGMTEFICRRREVECFEVNNATIRKHFIGIGRGERKQLKRLTIAACQARGWAPKSDDDADALAMMDFAMMQWDVPGVISGPLFGRAALEVKRAEPGSKAGAD